MDEWISYKTITRTQAKQLKAGKKRQMPTFLLPRIITVGRSYAQYHRKLFGRVAACGRSPVLVKYFLGLPHIAKTHVRRLELTM